MQCGVVRIQFPSSKEHPPSSLWVMRHHLLDRHQNRHLNSNSANHTMQPDNTFLGICRGFCWRRASHHNATARLIQMQSSLSHPDLRSFTEMQNFGNIPHGNPLHTAHYYYSIVDMGARIVGSLRLAQVKRVHRRGNAPSKYNPP